MARPMDNLITFIFCSNKVVISLDFRVACHNNEEP